MSKKSKSNLPKGWTEKRIREVIDHYENQTDDEAIAEDEHAHTRDHRAHGQERAARRAQQVANGEAQLRHSALSLATARSGCGTRAAPSGPASCTTTTRPTSTACWPWSRSLPDGVL